MDAFISRIWAWLQALFAPARVGATTAGGRSVEELAREIVAREGGYVNDPADPGGATKYGVTIGTMRALGIDLTGDGRVDLADVRVLTPERATEIFIQHYFRKPGIDQLPACLHDTVFDMQVNAGAHAVRILQRLLTRLGIASLKDDGEIGPKTVAAAREAERRHGGAQLRDLYSIARRDYYYDLAASRPASRKYAVRKDGGKGGWITRAEEFMRPESRLTDAQHRARVAAWR